MIYLITYLATGACAGLLSGLLGIGGGIIVVPGLIWAFTHFNIPDSISMHIAAGTSLAAMIFTGTVSAFFHIRRSGINWQIVYQKAPGIVLGTILGGYIAGFLPTAILKSIFGFFVFIIALRTFLLIKPHPDKRMPSILTTSLVGVGIGTLSGLIGIGGGSLIIPFLTRHNVSMREATTISAALIIPISITGTLTFAITGWHSNIPIQWNTGYIYWPAALGIAMSSMVMAPIGARLSQRLPTNTLKRIFAVFLFIVSIDMIMSTLH